MKDLGESDWAAEYPTLTANGIYKSRQEQDVAIKSQVDHPKHYNRGNIEVIEFLEDQKLDFHLANTVKYICRAGFKDSAKELEDLRKAAWYLARKIELVRAARFEEKPLRPNDMRP